MNKIIRKSFTLILVIATEIISSGAITKKNSSSTINMLIPSGNDPNFKITKNNDLGLSNFNRKVVVFGIDIYAAPKVEDKKLLHAANLMAQYLDNDEDGNIDNQLVVDKMKKHKAFLFLQIHHLEELGRI